MGKSTKKNEQVISIEKVANNRMSIENQKTLGKIAARVVSVQKQAEPGKSNTAPLDPLSALSVEGKIIEPPFDLLTLAMMPEHCSEMWQCIDVMSINIDGFGHRLLPRIKQEVGGKAVPNEISKAIKEEYVKLTNFFQYCTSESFIDFRRKIRSDKETTGNCYFEVVRNAAWEIQSFVHIPSYQMRLGRTGDQQIVDKKILRLNVDDSVSIDTVKEYRRFRKYVQSKSIQLRNLSAVGEHKLVWFKEFGDPNIYDARTGDLANDDLPVQHRATEIVHMKIYSPRTPYGLPRYIGNLLSIFGDRAAEEINYTTFKNNNIPSMAILVSNGQLTQGSIDRISSFVESQIQGSDNYSKVLILEAEGAIEGEESGSNVKVEIKALTENQHQDAMFQNYSKSNHDKIRRVWRLPPIFVGKADDYSKSTAEASRVLADEQIFSPERSSYDDFINRIIFPEMGVIYHKYRSNSPNTTDNQQMVHILSGSEKTGGMTPRIAREMLEEILSKELPDFPVDFPADVPFSMTMAEAVKNQADATEPGQQVTALKSVEDALMIIQKNMERKFEKEIENSRVQDV